MAKNLKVYAIAKSDFDVVIFKNSFKFIISCFVLAVILTFYFGMMDNVLFVVVFILAILIAISYFFSRKFAYKIIINYEDNSISFYKITGDVIKASFGEIKYKAKFYIVFYVRNMQIIYRDGYDKDLLNDLRNL